MPLTRTTSPSRIVLHADARRPAHRAGAGSRRSIWAMTERPPAATTPTTVLVHLVLAAMFALFAWLQRNDLDPAVYDRPSVVDAALWFGFYLLIAALCVWSLLRRVPQWLLTVAAVACLLELATTAPGLWENLFGARDFTLTQARMSADDPRVELSREFGGALIALGGVAFLWRRERRRPPATSG
jgi:hypothetical protein